MGYMMLSVGILAQRMQIQKRMNNTKLKKRKDYNYATQN